MGFTNMKSERGNRGDSLWLGTNRFGHLILVVAALLYAISSYGQDETDDEEESEEEEVEATELEDAPVVPQTEIEEVVVTGSRLQQSPGDLAGQTVVLDQDAIRAMGEVSIERLLRQLPQNLNPTAERFGSDLNTVSNFNGASTVNLRGLGSESTLILVDGKRVSHSGILGGVTDVSTIPLAMVERIEVVLDGASAIYGSDAVGGVINIITKKDYEGMEISLNVDTPQGAAYNDTRGSVAGSKVVNDQISVRGTYQRRQHSGLDASDRETTLFQQSIFPGPMYDVRFCCSQAGDSFPVFYRLGDDNLTLAEYNALSDAEKAAAEAIHYAVLPEGFNENSTVDDITELGMPNWGNETQRGFSILPEDTRDSFSLASDMTLGVVDVSAGLIGELRNTIYERGYITLSGESLSGGNPFNPFGRTIHLRGQRQDMPQPYRETDTTSYTFTFDVAGSISDGWDWEGNLAWSSTETETGNYHTIDRSTLRGGMNSDGVTPSTQYFFGLSPDECAAIGGTPAFGLCRVDTPAPPAINPWSDLSPYVNDVLMARGLNERMTLEGLIRGELFDAPGGRVRGLVGVHFQTLNLDSSSEFQVGTTDSPIGDVGSFDSKAERTTTSVFAEASIPLIGDNNAVRGVDKLILSVSVRNDSYDTPEATYIDAGEVTTEDFGSAEDLAETSWGVGFVWNLNDSIKLRLNQQSAFVAPQLNQLLRRSSENEAQDFDRLLVQLPDGSLRAHDTLVIEGGNSDLLAETATTSSFGIDLNPVAMPGFGLKVTYSLTEYEDRINRIINPIIDPNDLPSNTVYDADNDIYIQERRWINVSSVERAGIDYEFLYGWTNDAGDFDLTLKRSTVNKYDYTVDPTIDDPIGVVRHTEGRTLVGVVPEQSTNATFVWRRGGIEVAVDVAKRGKTSRTFTGVTNEYSPPTLADLSLSYTLSSGGWLSVPRSLDGARITFICNNLLEQYGKTEIRSSDGGLLVQSAPDSSPLYGRVFSISFTHLFPVAW